MQGQGEITKWYMAEGIRLRAAVQRIRYTEFDWAGQGRKGHVPGGDRGKKQDNCRWHC